MTRAETTGNRLPAIALVASGIAALAGACDGGDAGRTLVVHADPRAGIDLAAATWEPADAVLRASLVTTTRLELRLAREVGATVKVRAPGGCALEVSMPATGDASALHAEIAPWLDLGADRPQLGYDTPFTIRARRGCKDAEARPIAWRQVEGAPLDFRVDADGAGIAGRTPALATLGDRPWGVLPVAPRTRGAAAFEAVLEGPGWTARRTVRVAAAARATGLPTLSIGQRVMLGGEGWRVESAPLDSGAVVEPVAAGVAAFEPDVVGRWVLVDGEGRQLSLSAGRHDLLPLDCGRSECHASAAAGAVHSPMTHVLRRGLEGELGPDYNPRCALACHAVGEPGLDGFDTVAAALAFSVPERPRQGAWDALPASLRRLGGVGCTACHGPSALPEPSARWRILRGEVCATCHDAPPRYGHVAAWRASRMARADASPGTDAAGCADCHTTAGFLAWQGIRRAAPEGEARERTGVACAACHAAHGDATPKGLVRRTQAPEALGSLPLDRDAPTRVCLACHAPRHVEDAPEAAAAALWLGRGGRASREGGGSGAIDGPSPHGTVTDGCLGCHAAGPGDLERGAAHAFRADTSRCGRCHGGAVPPERPGPGGKRVSERAAALWAQIVARGWATPPGAGVPPHASREALRAPAEHARVVRNVLLVLEDPAAGVHNAPYARALLDDAERALGPAP